MIVSADSGGTQLERGIPSSGRFIPGPKELLNAAAKMGGSLAGDQEDHLHTSNIPVSALLGHPQYIGCSLLWHARTVMM